LAIPLLNAESKGVKIHRIIHSETQDGKTGVCDGYGATAGRHCKRALKRRSEQTEYNKICTPKELAQALASNGGLRNSGVQLVGTDRSGRLAEIVESFKSCVEDVADYFARANDITYFPDNGMCAISLLRRLPCMPFISRPAPVLQDDTEDWSNLDLSDPKNWSHVSFKLHVHAYSGIGPGATFCVDLCSGTVEPVDESGEESRNEEDLGDEESDSSDEDFEDMNDIARHRWALMSDGDDFESGDELDDDEDAMEEVVELQEGRGAWNEDPEKPFVKTPAIYYDRVSMVTGVQVSYHQPYGRIVGAKEVLKRKSKEQDDEDGDDTETPSTVIAKSVVAKALAMAEVSISSGEVTIRGARDEMEEYELAADWAQGVPDAALHRLQGWARRPNREDGMNGVSYNTDEYRKEIQIMFDEGANNSSKKMGPAEMLERLEEMFPGLYRYPGEIEISRAVSAMFEKQKKGKKKETEKAEKFPKAVVEKIREIMAKYPGQTGKVVEPKVSSSFNMDSKIGEWTYSRKDVMAKVNSLNQQAKQKKRKDAKRLLIC
jgi:hypothetical protein